MDDPYRIGRALNTNLHKVDDFIYIGNRAASESPQVLKKEGIVKTLQLLDFYIPNEIEDNIEIHFIKLEDSETEDLIKILPDALRYIQIAVNRQEKILIHCNAGVSRSGSVLIAYLMASLKINFREALNLAQAKRACISPNSGFTQQLRSVDLNYLISLIN